jgi:hypothetical protein
MDDVTKASQEERLKNILTMGAIAVMVTMCMVFTGDNDKPKLQTNAWEFGSMDKCISKIKTDVGPLTIVRDTPEEVLGKTLAGNTFACSRQVTGTRGTYFYGWYEH